ncbi:hypothetical protein SKAU_G00404210 [Synaphobranchus kaupii]|uniref:Ig-like domain-containing protein n=1 Tax=Synaphobranchus kaupii TaxID=118154 RepID=A0A9Q1E9M6_SYNKA|nr:hypothetical protein SKAU_G00404210 [Synaphobranchus kaupii]
MVRVMLKTHPQSGEQQMSCLATGFYPRHINMTLLRDGQTVPEERLITGELLPNGDGTYQQRKTLSLSVEERTERHDYTCTVTHTSLSNKLDITWEPGPAPDITFIAVAVSVVVFVIGVLVLAVAAFIKRKRRSAAIEGETQFPKFTAVWMVDDVQVEYFDSNDNEVISRRHWNVEEVVEEQAFKTSVMFHVRHDLNSDFQLLKSRFNHTGVRPRVRVMLKTHPESGAQQVSCLATGFYPRHINMTLLRDGQTVPEERLITGELLPNGNGTYQQRKTLSLSVKERPERHSYTCTVTHMSLSNKLDITWESGPAPDITFIAVAVSVVVSMIVVLVLAVAAFIKWKRRSAGE